MIPLITETACFVSNLRVGICSRFQLIGIYPTGKKAEASRCRRTAWMFRRDLFLFLGQYKSLVRHRALDAFTVLTSLWNLSWDLNARMTGR